MAAKRSQYSQVEFSPFDAGKLAVAAAQNFGIIGAGRQLVLGASPAALAPLVAHDTKDGVYDCSWSEKHPDHLAFANGDGSVRTCAVFVSVCTRGR